MRPEYSSIWVQYLASKVEVEIEPKRVTTEKVQLDYFDLVNEAPYNEDKTQLTFKGDIK